jgi:long-chain acyl-CoA synthetase
MSHLPVSHVFERELIFATIALGGTLVYSSGNISKIKDDLAIAKPTVFVGVPRLFSKFHELL